jgi:exonuclease VII small subunit
VWATIGAPVVLLAFVVGLALVVPGTAVAIVRGVELWRQLRHTNRAVSVELGSFEERTARTERHLAEWERSSAELEAALSRLRVSRARLRVLQDAIDQAQARVRWLRVFVPR